MIRILQQDNRIVKAVFAIIIGAAIITMVISLVPGIFDNGVTGDGSVYDVIHEPGFFGKIAGDTKTVKTEAVTRTAQQMMTQQKLPAFLLQYMMQRAGQQAI